MFMLRWYLWLIKFLLPCRVKKGVKIGLRRFKAPVGTRIRKKKNKHPTLFSKNSKIRGGGGLFMLQDQNTGLSPVFFYYHHVMINVIRIILVLEKIMIYIFRLKKTCTFLLLFIKCDVSVKLTLIYLYLVPIVLQNSTETKFIYPSCTRYRLVFI